MEVGGGASPHPRSLQMFNKIIKKLNCTIAKSKNFRNYDQNNSQICSKTRKETEFSMGGGRVRRGNHRRKALLRVFNTFPTSSPNIFFKMHGLPSGPPGNFMS